MAGDGRQAGVRVQSGSSKSHCCLKFAVTLLTIAVIVLVCIVLWLVYRTPTTTDGSKPGAQSAATRGLVEDEVCKLPKDVGPCRGAFLRYYYDYETKRCDEFMYGGCQGNANNFESIVECQERCMKPAEKAADVDVCKLPQDTGPCRALLPRFAYNDTVKACVPFTYGGCQGNGNNFETKEECEEKCMAPSDDPCKQPIKVGPCLALIPRYAFDSAAGECVEFMYGGCNPNDNNFETLEACQAKCPGKTVKAAATDVCELPQETGPCRARFIRYAYDGKAKVCVPFTYGGCQGNENNFETKEECEEKCMAGEKAAGIDVCKLPQDAGPCLARIRRFAYDYTSKTCVPFYYGGCQGNGNNFESKEECEEKCAESFNKAAYGVEDPCKLPIDVGPCLALVPRYAFDQKAGKCVSFDYGGCQGNKNNFETLEACQQTCPEASKLTPSNLSWK